MQNRYLETNTPRKTDHTEGSYPEFNMPVLPGIPDAEHQPLSLGLPPELIKRLRNQN